MSGVSVGSVDDGSLLQVELKEGVCLVCLPARGVEQAAGSRCTVSGYGYQGESECFPPEYSGA